MKNAHITLPALRTRWRLLAGGSRTDEYWLEISIGSGWVAAYRLAHVGRGAHRRAKIMELRVFPDEPGRHPGEWSAARSPKEPFSFTRLHRLVTEKNLNSALAATAANARRQGAFKAFGTPGLRHAGTPKKGTRAGRPPSLTMRFLARLALRYETLEGPELRESRRSTRQILAREYDKPETTIAKWLSIARREGLLTPVARGERGGRATEHARHLASLKQLPTEGVPGRIV